MNTYNNSLLYYKYILIITFIVAVTIFSNKLLAKSLTEISVVLDWTPNTNHTGIVVAKQLGYYAKEGLNVKIIQPSKASSELLVAKNFANFGISSDEGSFIEALSKGMPIISIAAIIANDTSGFYSIKSKNINTPKDFEGKVYGSWGTNMEIAILKAMMQQYGADFNKVKIVTIGNIDIFRTKNIDFVWGFEAWTGIKAKIKNIQVNYIPVKNIINKGGYTPIIITNKYMLENKKDIIHKFMNATAKGYHYSIAHPKEAAHIFLEAYPELDKNLIITSQEYLSSAYKGTSSYWGYQNPKIWQQYLTWITTNNVINKKINLNQVFTNTFLPKH